MSTDEDVLDLIESTIYREVNNGWEYNSETERSLAVWDPRPTAEAVLAILKAQGFVQIKAKRNLFGAIYTQISENRLNLDFAQNRYQLAGTIEDALNPAE